ncbi:hypothetical protein DL96DRAFT_1823505 [Flagelloscypha sp. PMI_526]|nr:hypothetical protein DL96DRAFT_1823505 [Flagelloscypha sp. PMI_526]
MNSPILHHRFNAPDADISIISSDNVLFRVHSKNLTLNSGAFPLDLEYGDPSSNNEPAGFEESSKILEYLFAFLYSDEDHPTLGDCDFATILYIGIAANKWMIPAAKSVCYLRIIAQPGEFSALGYLAHFHKDDPILESVALSCLKHHSSLIMPLFHDPTLYHLRPIYPSSLLHAWRLWKLRWMEYRQMEACNSLDVVEFAHHERSNYEELSSNLCPTFAECLDTVEKEGNL